MALGKRSSLENKMNMYLTHEQELFCILPGKSFLENASVCGDPNILACPIKRHIMEYYLKKGPSNCYFTLYFDLRTTQIGVPLRKKRFIQVCY